MLYIENGSFELEFASISWSPNCLNLKKKLESVQNNCAKFITNTYPKKGNYENFSITKILDSIGWKSLESRRNQARLIMAYKILNKQVILESELLPKNNISHETRKNNYQENLLKERFSRLDSTQKTFFYAVPKLWNKYISPTQAKAPTVDSFKKYFERKKSEIV